MGVASFKSWPTFVVAVDTFIPAMRRKGRLVLTDNLLLGEVYQARKAGSRYQTNTSSVMCWDGNPKPDSVSNSIRYLSQSKPTGVLIVMLSPNGGRAQPEDITFCPE